MRRRLIEGDQVGLGWRLEIGPSILANLDQIDAVEVILDDYLKAPRSQLSALNTLACQVPVLYHGVGLGLATSLPVEQKRLDALARLFDFLCPEAWSEHLAFVRAGGIEIGHLAAPPRSAQTIDGSLANLEQIKKTIGSYPALENIATLIDPPGSKYTEPEWVGQIITRSGCKLLLDLHNLYANALNFGVDPLEYMKLFPLHQVQQAHLSGGKWINEPPGYQSNDKGKRLLDDHVHDIPEAVFTLLKCLALAAPQPLTVIIERDGDYPEFQILLHQIQKTRSILTEARKERSQQQGELIELADV